MVRRFLTGLLVAALFVATVALPARADTPLEQVPGLERVKAVAAAGNLYAALRADGSVWTWDVGAEGIKAVKPQRIEIDCRVRSVTPGADRLALLCADGTVWTSATSSDTRGSSKAVQAPGLDAIESVAMARSALVALRADGTVLLSEFSANQPGVGRGEPVAELANITAIAAGIDDFVAVGADGSAWSRLAINTKGTSVKRLAALPPVRDVAVCGPGDDCDDTDSYLFVTLGGEVLTADTDSDGAADVTKVGQVECSGCVMAGHWRFLSITGAGNVQSNVMLPSGKVIVNDIKMGNAKQVASGSQYDLLLAADGTVWMWAAPTLTALSQIPGLTDVKEIASAGQWNLALAADGRVIGWSDMDTQRTWVIPHVLETAHVVATPDYYLLVGVDGSVATGQWPASGAVPAEPLVHRDISARSIAAYVGHVTVVKRTGEVQQGKIAIDESGVHIIDLTLVSGLDSAVQVAAGAAGYLVLRADGTVWGARWDASPAPVKDIARARAIAAGGNTFAVLLGDGSVRGIAIDEPGMHVWGDPYVEDVETIAAGGGGGGAGGGGAGGVVALRADGTAVTFSRTVGAGQVSEIIDGIAVSAGGQQNLVLRADGTVWTWRASGR